MEITPIPITSLNRKVALTEKNADNGLGYILSGGPVLTLEFKSATIGETPISQPFDFNIASTTFTQDTTSGFGSGISFTANIIDGYLTIESIETGGDNYFVGDTIDFTITEVDSRPVITLTVTELEDLGINKGKGVVVYYDRYDQVLYYTTYIGEEEFSFTANGEIYEPTELPTDYKEAPSGSVTDTTWSDDLLTIRVTYDVPPNKIITSTATIETYIGNYLQVTISDLGLSQSLTVSSAEIDPDDELTIKITMVEPLPYDEEILIDILHLNGLEYWNSSQITIGPIANPFGGTNYIPTDGYTKVTDAPYFIDESYNITIYTADDLEAMGLDTTGEKSYTITSLGFPFHLTETTDSGNVTDEDVADGVFKLAAKIVNLPFNSEPPSPATITYDGLTLEIANSVLIGDNGFKQDIINPFVDKMVGEVIIIGETKRYVFFPVDPFVYSGGDLAIIFYMDGAGASWAAGYTEMNRSIPRITVGEVINMTTPSESESQLNRKTSIVINAYEILPRD